MVCDKVVCDKWCVTKLREAEAEAEAAGRRRDGIQTQKQEPHTKMWGKTQCFAAFLPFPCIFFRSDSFSSLIFFLLFFSSLTLPTSAFPSLHIVGSLTSNLPSIKESFMEVLSYNP